jgi:ribose-phosphate pyrophosphokinase
MAVRVADLHAPLGRRARARSRRLQPEAVAPFVVVLPGYERFVFGLRGGSFARLAVKRFPNGELHVEVPAQLEGRRCILVGSISPPAGNLERFTVAAHTLARAGAQQVTALLPYLAYARQDRAPRSESLGLAWVGELLEASGVDEVVTVDVHSDLASEVLGLALTSLSPAGVIATALRQALRPEATVVAPDEGAIDRCSAVARAAGVAEPIVWVRKERTSAGIEHHGLVGSPGKRALVIDDILDTGDTLVSCCRALRDFGVQEIGVVATHGLFTGDHWRALLTECVQVWITDTVLSPRRPPQAHVVSIAPLLAPLLDESGDRGGSDARDRNPQIR